MDWMNKVDFTNLKPIGYARKSKVERAGDNKEDMKILSIEGQVKWINEYGANHNLSLVTTSLGNPIEENQTAYHPGRPNFNQMVELVEQGLCDSLLIYSISRLSRNPKDSGTIQQLLKDDKLKAIITPEYTYVNNTSDKTNLNLQFLMAENQSNTTSDAVKRDLKGKIARKEFPTIVCAPYLNIDKEGRIAGKSFDMKKMIMLTELGRPLKRIEIDPIEGAIWHQLGEEIIRDRLTLGQAQKRAHALHLMGSYSNKPIVKSTIRNTFANPFLYGMMRLKSGLVEGNHEPLFTKDEWELINAFLTDSKKAKFKVKDVDKYNKLCVCGECERPVCTEPPKRNGKVYLRCTKTRKDMKCSQKYLEIHDFESQIEEQLKGLVLSDRLIHWIVKQLEQSNEFELKRSSVLRDSIQAKLKRIDDDFNAYTKRWSSAENINGDFISNDEYLLRKQEYKKDRNSLEEELAKVFVYKDGWLDEVEEFFEYARTLNRTFHDHEDHIEEKKRLLHIIASNITIKDKKATINYNTKYVVIKNIKESKIEEIPQFEQLNAYSEASNPIYEPVLEKIRRAVDNVRTAILNLDCYISIPILGAI